MDLEEKRGLWDNIHAKRERIKHGSGEHMRKPGSKGAPTAADLKNSQTKTESYQTAELQSKNKNDPSSRFDSTDSLINIYKKDTPGQSTKKIVKQAIREMLESQCPCGGGCECDKPKPKKNVDENKEYENPTGGLSQKGRDHYNSTTGSHLQAPVTKEPSKLKKGSKSYNRRKSFCARMGGMKKRLTGAKTANDPDSRINKALRKWNC
jgi:hypothetical protein